MSGVDSLPAPSPEDSLFESSKLDHCVDLCPFLNQRSTSNAENEEFDPWKVITGDYSSNSKVRLLEFASGYFGQQKYKTLRNKTENVWQIKNNNDRNNRWSTNNARNYNRRQNNIDKFDIRQRVKPQSRRLQQQSSYMQNSKQNILMAVNNSTLGGADWQLLYDWSLSSINLENYMRKTRVTALSDVLKFVPLKNQPEVYPLVVTGNFRILKSNFDAPGVNLKEPVVTQRAKNKFKLSHKVLPCSIKEDNAFANLIEYKETGNEEVLKKFCTDVDLNFAEVKQFFTPDRPTVVVDDDILASLVTMHICKNTLSIDVDKKNGDFILTKSKNHSVDYYDDSTPHLSFPQASKIASEITTVERIIGSQLTNVATCTDSEVTCLDQVFGVPNLGKLKIPVSTHPVVAVPQVIAEVTNSPLIVYNLIPLDEFNVLVRGEISCFSNHNGKLLPIKMHCMLHNEESYDSSAEASSISNLLRVNTGKLFRWVCQATVAGSQNIKLVNVIRHQKPSQFLYSINSLSLVSVQELAIKVGFDSGFMWTILYSIFSKLKDVPDGSYALYREAMKLNLQLYQTNASNIHI